MKFPKYLGEFSAGNGFAAGSSKSNSLEIVDVPYLTSATGPGFTTYKKGAFTDVVTEPTHGGPFIWGIVPHTANVEVMSVGDPYIGKVITPVGVTSYATNIGIRAGGGYILCAARDANTEETWPLLIDARSEQYPVASYAKNMLLQGTPHGVSGAMEVALAAMFATGKDRDGKYRWGVARYGFDTRPTDMEERIPAISEETIPVSVYTTIHDQILIRDFDGSTLSITQDRDFISSLDVRQIRVDDTTSRRYLSNYPSLTVYLGDDAPPSKPGAPRNAKSVTLIDGQEVDRMHYTAGPFCIGPSVLIVLVMPEDEIKTSVYTNIVLEEEVITFGDPFSAGPYWVADYAVPTHAGPNGYTDVRGVRRTELFTGTWKESIAPYLKVSRDHGETWVDVPFSSVFDFELSKGTGLHTVVHTITNYPFTTTAGGYTGYVNAQLFNVANGFYACYLGKGKSIVLIPGMTLVEGSPLVVDATIYPTACYLLDTLSLTSERIAWPGDDATSNIDPSACGKVGRSVSGCFGVGCFVIAGRYGGLYSTRDFGATWTTTDTIYPQDLYDQSTGGVYQALPLWPTVVSPYKTVKKPDGTTEVISKGYLSFSTQALKHITMMEVSTDGTFETYFQWGTLYSPEPKPATAPRPAYRPFYYSLFYGRPGQRSSPRPELGHEFDITPKL